MNGIDGISLEAHLEDADISGEQKSVEGFNPADFIKEINNALNESSFYSKSKISHRNLRGILRGYAFQDYLMHKYGWRLSVLDELISNKIRNSLSIDGIGRKEIIDAIGRGTIKVEAKSGFDFADRLFGNNMPPR